MESSENSKIPTLRPHHGMCIANFEGKGYSPSFTERMTTICETYPLTDPVIRLTVACDDSICIACPFNQNGICESEAKVQAFDRSVLTRIGLTEGSLIRYNAFQEMVARLILQTGNRPQVCQDCQWNSICEGNDPERRDFVRSAAPLHL